MKPRRIRNWEDLEALPEGEWVEVAGMDFDVVDETTAGQPRFVAKLKPAQARALKPRKGDVLVATVRGRRLEVVRQRPRKPARG